LENSTAYSLKVNRVLCDSPPTYNFNSYSYYTVSIGAMSTSEEINEDTFRDAVKRKTFEDWKEVIDIESNSTNGAFMIQPKAILSRAAYISTFGGDFKKDVYDVVKKDKGVM
jgi:hypothetical protein